MLNSWAVMIWQILHILLATRVLVSYFIGVAGNSLVYPVTQNTGTVQVPIVQSLQYTPTQEILGLQVPFTK